MGNYKKAESLYLEGKEIREEVLGKKHISYILNLFNLSNIYGEMGEFDKAEQYSLEAKAIIEELSGKESVEYGQNLDFIGTLYTNMGLYDKAEEPLKEAIEVWEKLLGRENIIYAKSIHHLANLYSKTGEYQKSEPLFVEAGTLRKKFLGENHPKYIRTQYDLAILYSNTGEYSKASKIFLEVAPAEKSLLLKASRHTSEQELAAYTREFASRLNLVWSLGQVDLESEAELLGLCYDQALFYKGFLLNTSNQIRQLSTTDSLSQQKLDQLRGYHRELSVEYAKPLADRQGVEELEEEINALEKDLAVVVAGYNQALKQVSWQEVQNQLKPNEAAIEFIHYKLYQPGAGDSTMYAALVLKPGAPVPKFIPLFEERDIKALMSNEQAGRSNEINNLYAFASRGVKPGRKITKSLTELQWQPLEKELTEVKTIYFAPSGLLHRINLSAIPLSDGKTLGDQYQMIQLNSTRQLVVPHSKGDYNQEAILFGGIQYENGQPGYPVG